MNKPKLNFILDQEYDSAMIYHMLKAQTSAAGLAYQSRIMEIPAVTAKKISQANSIDQIEALVTDLAQKRYQEIGSDLDVSRISYQKSWNEINDKFFQRIVEITKFPIQHQNFYCAVSAFHFGISSWGGNKIARKYKLDWLEQRRITAHELIISHFFSIIGKKYPNVLKPGKTWKLAEILAFIVTGEDKILKTFWPWDQTGSYTDHNYPEIVELQKILTPIYLNKGFEAFLAEGIKKAN